MSDRDIPFVPAPGENFPAEGFSRRNFLTSAVATGLVLTAGAVMAQPAVARVSNHVTPSASLDYTGPEEINDLVVGVPVQLQGFTADGGPITWSVVANEYVTLSPEGLLTPIAPTPRDANGDPIPLVIQITLDDGKP